MKFNFFTVKDFYTQNITDDVLKKVGLSTGILIAVVISQIILHGFVQIIDSIPIFDSLMQIVGVYATVKFARANLITQEQRSNLKENVRNTYQKVVG